HANAAAQRVGSAFMTLFSAQFTANFEQTAAAHHAQPTVPAAGLLLCGKGEFITIFKACGGGAQGSPHNFAPAAFSLGTEPAVIAAALTDEVDARSKTGIHAEFVTLTVSNRQVQTFSAGFSVTVFAQANIVCRNRWA